MTRILLYQFSVYLETPKAINIHLPPPQIQYIHQQRGDEIRYLKHLANANGFM